MGFRGCVQGRVRGVSGSGTGSYAQELVQGVFQPVSGVVVSGCDIRGLMQGAVPEGWCSGCVAGMVSGLCFGVVLQGCESLGAWVV